MSIKGSVSNKIADGLRSACGSLRWWRTPQDDSSCRLYLVSVRSLILAVKVWSDHLGEKLWMSATELPSFERPQDISVDIWAEVDRGQKVGPDILRIVHAVKWLL